MRTTMTPRAARTPATGRTRRAGRGPGAPRTLTLATALLAGTLLAAATALPGFAGPAPAAAPGPSVTLISDTRLDDRALYFVSYNGLVNNNSFQKNGILTHRGHQYAAWYTADRSAVIARRALGTTDWRTLTLDHRLTTDDSHNVISMGVSAADGRLHILMDSHSDGLHYVKSEAGLMNEPAARAWRRDALGPVQTSLDGLRLTEQFTYPQFVAVPGGALQLSYRAGVSGNGRNGLAEYDGGGWRALGEWTSSTGTYTSEHGSSTTRNMYLHGIDYSADGTLHAFYTWREGNSAVMCAGGGLTNHDTGYVRSTDRGRTWRNAAGTVVGTTGGGDRVAVGDPGTVADPLDPDHALMNQESQATDSRNLPHAVISYVPGRFGQCTTDYVRDRVNNGRAFHVHRDAAGAWHKTEIPEPLRSSQRTKLAFDRHDNAYAILPFGRIAAASAASGWTDWKLLYDASGLNAFGEVVLDETRLAQDGVLSFLYQERSTGTTPSPVHVIDFALPG
ncbi:BNR repeat-containing protein [Streptomyces sp. WAC 00631]|uniref:BNR repeat-containing protein n=1 Tax=Streptomyces sp. WAC 00631 TaxID=2203201 RepID=UPI001E4A6224|nr:BNR repeat-containing protein [Streptomyces sp. WAC 00631]MCC5037234.1 BNR repeat-containing protein [Streptomyces sp. WAC 00631]